MSGAYPDEFDDELKQQVKERDNYMCVECGITEAESKAMHGRELSVHHKDEDKTNNELSNLATICISCHQRVHWHNDRLI